MAGAGILQHLPSVDFLIHSFRVHEDPACHPDALGSLNASEWDPLFKYKLVKHADLPALLTGKDQEEPMDAGYRLIHSAAGPGPEGAPALFGLL